jgi:GNAT superfamily N-acetyltransferase
MKDLEIRPAQPGDLDSLVEFLGQQPYFAERLAWQHAGRGILLTAWKDGQPQGDVYLRLDLAEEPEIREHLPGVPFLTHLEVRPGYRNRGIGTKLIKAAEAHLHRLGHTQVALAVEINNVDAARLYKRLGYLPWPHTAIICYSALDNRRTRIAEVCNVLVKPLPSER